MITEEQKAKSAAKRIRILREGFPNDPEVLQWDIDHPGEAVEVEGQDRLTTEEVAAAEETVPAAGVSEPQGRIGGRRVPLSTKHE